MRKLHKWIKKDVSWHQICDRCGATRWGGVHGWGRAMKDGMPQRWCKELDNDNR